MSEWANMIHILPQDRNWAIAICGDGRPGTSFAFNVFIGKRVMLERESGMMYLAGAPRYIFLRASPKEDCNGAAL